MNELTLKEAIEVLIENGELTLDQFPDSITDDNVENLQMAVSKAQDFVNYLKAETE